MRFMRYRRVQFFAVGSILTVSLSACNETPTFSQAGVLTKVASPQAPSEDAVASGTDEESSNDPIANGPAAPLEPIDDLTAEDKGETPQDGVGVTRWLFNSSAFLTGVLNYSSSSNEVTQSLVMDNNTSLSETSFYQLDRPTITDLFAQSSDLRSVSESFQQNSSASGALDLLLVIDNSGSMAEEQVNLSDKLSPLLSFVQNSDWRIGVVTTDPKDGCLRSLISKNDQNGMTAFASAVQPGIKGSGNERGIQQAVAGLKGECNSSGSWLRNQSTVGVLIVSDEDNCSDGKGCGTDPWATQSYLSDYLRSIRQPGINARVYGLIGHPSLTSAQCKTMAAKANQYAAVIDETGGSWGSICDADYTQTLQAISKDISVILLTQFNLKNVPIANTLKVYKNDVLISSGYTVHENLVEFQSAPAAGTAIRFEYEWNAIPPKTEFALREKADLGTLAVSIDGVESKAYHYDAGNNAIVFDSAPNSQAIKAVYRRGDPLLKEFSIGAGLDIRNLSVKVNKVALSAGGFSYRSGDGMVVLNQAPSDKATVAVSYEKILEHHLDYPIYFSADAAVSSWDEISGARVNSTRQDNLLSFASSDYSPGRKLTIKAQTAANWKVPVLEGVKASSLKVQSGAINCSNYKFENNVLDMTACGWGSGTKVAVNFEYEAEHQERFDLAMLQGVPGNVKWEVRVNAKVLKDSEYYLENGGIRIPNLATNAQVEVLMIGK